MIHVSPECYAAVFSDSAVWKPRILWSIDGGSIDISDRLVQMSDISSTMGAFLSGYTATPVSISLDNTDLYLSSIIKETSLLASKPADAVLSSTVAVDIGIQLPSGAFEYIPVGRLFFNDPSWTPGVVEFRCRDYYSTVLTGQLPDTIILGDYYGSTLYKPHRAAQRIITDNSPLTNANFNGDELFYMDDMLDALDWTVNGGLQQGASMDTAVNLLTRSGMCAFWPDESGMIRVYTMFPKNNGVTAYAPNQYVERVDSANAFGFGVSRPRELFATEIIVRYQGVAAPWRDSSLEARVGRVPRTLDCTFIQWFRCARLAARLFFESGKSHPHTLQWSMGTPGLLMQLNDRVVVEHPVTGTAISCRVTSKSVSFDGRCTFEAVVEGHEATVVDGTFAYYGVTSYGGSEVML